LRYQVEIEPHDDRAVISLRASGAAVVAIEAAIGASLPGVGCSERYAKPNGVLLGVGPNEWLAVVERAQEQHCFDELKLASAQHHASVIVMTDGYFCSALSGADASAVLSQVCGIDLHCDVFGDGAVARTAFAKVSAVIHCLQAGNRYEIYADSGLRGYVCGYLEAAAGPG
jgi:sarcosine oxidase subunit gamma